MLHLMNMAERRLFFAAWLEIILDTYKAKQRNSVTQPEEHADRAAEQAIEQINRLLDRYEHPS